LNSTLSTLSITSTESASAPPVSTSASQSTFNATSSVIASTQPISTSAPTSSIVSGFDVQPPGDPAQSHSFTPFPTPSQQPVSGESTPIRFALRELHNRCLNCTRLCTNFTFAGIFIPTDPSNPPPPTSNVQSLPDFNQAWASALAKAKVLVSGFSIDQKVSCV